ncbi:tRNA (adenosine(37)-N6)-threonylcarbamoyltransferase complex ATPase subunit type 1 TsaE, partial [Candidatus Margulisiibacteriota bacterium]
LGKGQVIALIGQLAAGKTTFVQGLADQLQIKDYVVSPTFTLVNEYRQGKMPLYHIDLYRLNSLEEALAAGIQEYLPPEDGITVVEWADHIPELLPPKHTAVTLSVVEDTIREISILNNNEETQ